MNNFDQFLSEFKSNAGASDDVVQAEMHLLNANFPVDYLAFLSVANGGEGVIGETYLMLWRIDELAKMNAAYQVDEYAPGLMLIGSDGGGDAFAFDTRINPWHVVKVPFVGMGLQDVELLSPSFESFLKMLKS